MFNFEIPIISPSIIEMNFYTTLQSGLFLHIALGCGVIIQIKFICVWQDLNSGCSQINPLPNLCDGYSKELSFFAVSDNCLLIFSRAFFVSYHQSCNQKNHDPSRKTFCLSEFGKYELSIKNNEILNKHSISNYLVTCRNFVETGCV